MAGSIHYEVYIRKTAPAPWALQMATEERAVAMETAEELLLGGLLLLLTGRFRRPRHQGLYARRTL